MRWHVTNLSSEIATQLIDFPGLILVMKMKLAINFQLVNPLLGNQILSDWFSRAVERAFAAGLEMFSEAIVAKSMSIGALFGIIQYFQTNAALQIFWSRFQKTIFQWWSWNSQNSLSNHKLNCFNADLAS